MQVYCDTEQYEINEAGCWDPKAETLTIVIDGEEVTKTWFEWSGALIGTGAYANADFDTKLHVTATMEEEFLKKYYRIPFAGTTVCTMLGDQLNFYTEDYNIMYGWGGLQLATWNYNDTEWYNYVQSNNGTLSYQ
jgi:oligopeptide transport system substrate-binding protein